MITGSCLCGATRFKIDGDLPPGTICHCGQCRRQTSHVYASVHIPETSLTLSQDVDLRWYSASPVARRGFCSACGTVLFWNPGKEDKISVSLGALDDPHPGRPAMHIFTGDTSDHYDFDGALPQRDTF